MSFFVQRKERETVHGVRWTPVLHRPKPTLCGLRPRYPLAGAEPCRALLAQKKDIHSDIFFCATKSARRDSNPRPRPWQGRAPPTEPLAHVLRFLNARPILPKTSIFVNPLFSKTVDVPRFVDASSFQSRYFSHTLFAGTAFVATMSTPVPATSFNNTSPMATGAWAQI